ncbi:MAG TPA: hypothetical protein VGL53_03160, partial [Bryobacteraceae bacterium]
MIRPERHFDEMATLADMWTTSGLPKFIGQSHVLRCSRRTAGHHFFSFDVAHSEGRPLVSQITALIEDSGEDENDSGLNANGIPGQDEHP